AVALEKLVRLDREEDVEVTRRSAAQARLALAREPDARAVLDARRDVDRERALLGGAARAAAALAGVLNRLAAPLAARAGPLDGEEALARAHFALAATHRARRRLGAGLGSGARACFTGNAGRHRSEEHTSELQSLAYL